MSIPTPAPIASDSQQIVTPIPRPTFPMMPPTIPVPLCVMPVSFPIPRPLCLIDKTAVPRPFPVVFGPFVRFCHPFSAPVLPEQVYPDLAFRTRDLVPIEIG